MHNAPTPLLALGLALVQATTMGGATPLTPRQTTACEDVHIFIARGSEEPYPGRQSSIVDAVCSSLASASASCGYEDITYPATFDAYCASVYAGVTGGAAALAAYAAACPAARLVLTGYSQGAQLVGDVLGGAGGEFGDCTEQTSEPLARDGALAKQIAAVTLFGDVRHVAGQSYNTGTGADKDGIYPRASGALDAWADILKSWCSEDDPVCAQGGDINAHTAYFDLFTDAAAEFIVAQLA
ncbi:carbohydrate esterase family 5 protein [Xylariomycetidae sp. FL0641]|nr:carbohydrate esterase family 5 protein [Xylariomycetidae sp. FL0641]